LAKRKRDADEDDDKAAGAPDRCDACGGLMRRCGGWEQALAVCVCSKQSSFKHGPQPVRGDDFSDVLTHGGHLAHPGSFGAFAGARSR
jgi:hypothetical protein